MSTHNWFQDQPFPLLGVELQYFRTPRHRWEQMLFRLRQIGANTISTYVMWGWHEPAEGQFDFTGQTAPERDLVGFIRLVQEMGFLLLLKPGPFIDAETLGGGIPSWLLTKIPQAHAIRQDGKPWRHSDSDQARLSYLHPEALEQAQRWYAAFSQAALPFQWPQGPVIALQIDNETPGDGFIAGDQDDPGFDYHFRGDYNPAYIQDLWPQWLESRYGGTGNISAAYEMTIADYDQASLPAQWTEPTSVAGLRRWMDVARFTDWTFNRAIRLYANRLQESGWHIPLFQDLLCMPWEASGILVNMGALASSVGWLGQNVYSAAVRQPFVDYGSCRLGFEEYVQHAIWRSRLTKNYSSNFPSFVPEISAAGDFYLQSMAAGGVEAINIYAGVQSNPEPGQIGVYPRWCLDAPIRTDGSLRRRFWNVKTLFDYLGAGGKGFAAGHMPADITLAYTHTPELAWQWFFSPDYFGKTTGRSISTPVSDEITATLAGAESAALSQAIAQQLVRMQIDFDVLDIDFARPEQLSPNKLLIAPASAIMARRTQDNLAEFLRQGGSLVWVGGDFPDLDENLMPYQALKQAALDLEKVWKLNAGLPADLADQILKAGFPPRLAWCEAAEGVDVTVRHGAEQMTFLAVANRNIPSYEGGVSYLDENRQAHSIQARLAGPHVSFIALLSGRLESALLYGRDGGAYIQAGTERFAIDRGQVAIARFGFGLLISSPESANVYVLRESGWDNIKLWRLLLNGQVRLTEARIAENLLALTYQPEADGLESVAILAYPTDEPLAPGLRPYFDTALSFVRITLTEAKERSRNLQNRLSSTETHHPATGTHACLPEAIEALDQLAAQAISKIQLTGNDAMSVEAYQACMEEIIGLVGRAINLMVDVLRQARAEIAADQLPAGEVWIEQELSATLEILGRLRE